MPQQSPGDEEPTGEEVSVLCHVDVQKHGLDVGWTKGAVFHFESRETADWWVERQNRRVTGTLHLKSDIPGGSVLDPDLYLQYRPRPT